MKAIQVTQAMRAILVIQFKKLLSLLLFVLALSLPVKISEIGTEDFKHQQHNGFLADKQFLERERKCVESALYHEARGEPTEGVIAVLEVIVNRKQHPKYPKTFCAVILQDKQFSAFNNNPSKALKSPFEQGLKETKADIQLLAEKAVYGRLNDSDKVLDDPEVLYYHTVSVKPRWSRKMQRVKQVGKHQFFKET